MRKGGGHKMTELPLGVFPRVSLGVFYQTIKLVRFLGKSGVMGSMGQGWYQSKP
jgi:hypothetical protein